LAHDLHLGRAVTDGADARIALTSLRTHGVVVGMTGSGKTGMALVMLEELVAAGVPVIAIDPKGDLGNLGLLFPDASAADLAPWVEGDDPAQAAERTQAGPRHLADHRRQGPGLCATASPSPCTPPAPTPACPSTCSARCAARPPRSWPTMRAASR
jgi:hypothetical protein